MKKIIRADILSNEEYSKQRAEQRKWIIQLKNLRRVHVGDTLSFTFENRDTVIYQIQEMMRVERIEDDYKIQHEINVYNDLIPERGVLSATMFIEIRDTLQIKPILDRFQGLDQKGTVSISVNGKKTFADFEPGHSTEDRISAVHYLKFLFSEDQIRDFQHGKVEMEVRHPSYMAKTMLSDDQKQEIAKDLIEE